MNKLIGKFGQLMITYAINKKNNFKNGIDFEDAWDNFDAESTAALFVSCYPEFGEYKGGMIEHDPVFTAFFDIKGIWGVFKKIPGYNVFILLGSIALGASVFMVKLRRKK